MPKTVPPRQMDPYAAEFWEHTKQHELRLQECQSCGKFRWPPSQICDRCLSERYEWQLASGQATLKSWVEFKRAYFEEWPAPHTTIVVVLPEGPMFPATIAEDVDPQTLHLDLQMKVDWISAQDRSGEFNLPVFRPA